MIRVWIFLIPFLCSCSGHVYLNSRTCPNNDTELISIQKEWTPTFRVEKKVWTTWADQEYGKEVDVKEILGHRRIKCEQVEYVKVMVRQSFWDVVVSALPYYQRQTMVVEGSLKN